VRVGPFDLEVPFEDGHQVRQRQVDVRLGDPLAETVGADVAELADGGGVGVEAVGKTAVLDQPLDQVLQRPACRAVP